MRRPGRAALVLALAAACAGCAGHARNATRWDGRRGYDGSGDYGYDVATSRAEAGTFRARAAATYPAPGTPDDPWGPYIHEASLRFQVQEGWIRAVMRQESGGRQYDGDGTPITSSAGAMGLMQVMPRTFGMLRDRYSLGGDPYDPHDNILAGTAYIREMADRYGSPGFLAAYNAGPDRMDAYLAGTDALPEETVNYLASVSPRLGGQTAASADPADRAFEGGGLVTRDAPTGVFTPAQPAPIATLPTPIASTAPPPPGDWAIQVGAYPNPSTSWAAISTAQADAGDLLASAHPTIIPVQRTALLYRARLLGLSADAASAACARLAGQGMDCFTVPPGS